MRSLKQLLIIIIVLILTALLWHYCNVEILHSHA
jgi:hypothetical protein